ncbi:MAG: beta-ketoacyl-[acyl-carrier-protein] synthase family protein [Flavitalea sp.]
MSDLVVTGMGIITAIGSTVSENHESLKNGICGITTLSNFPSRFSGILPCGEIKISTAELRNRLGVNQKGVTRTDLLCQQAFKDAVSNAALTDEELTSTDTVFINGNTVGGMCLTDELYHDANAADNGSEYLASYDCAAPTLHIQQTYKLRGLTNTINTACSSSANAIMYGAKMIRNGFAKRAIVGGVDSLAKFTINGFNSLHILSPELCRPFDKNRRGLNLGEAAAFIVIERAEDVSSKKIYAKLIVWSNSNDAYHPSSLSEEGDGPLLAMLKALEVAGLQAGDISFINMHGTGTENNDEVESRAVKKLFKNPPPFSSTKSNTGHTLGAAGAVEAIFSILNIHHQEIYASLNFSDPIEETALKPNIGFKSLPINHVMSNSFGFGGNCSSLILSKA